MHSRIYSCAKTKKYSETKRLWCKTKVKDAKLKFSFVKAVNHDDVINEKMTPSCEHPEMFKIYKRNSLCTKAKVCFDSLKRKNRSFFVKTMKKYKMMTSFSTS